MQGPAKYTLGTFDNNDATGAAADVTGLAAPGAGLQWVVWGWEIYLDATPGSNTATLILRKGSSGDTIARTITSNNNIQGRSAVQGVRVGIGENLAVQFVSTETGSSTIDRVTGIVYATLEPLTQVGAAGA